MSKYPVLLFVATAREADHIRSNNDPADLIVAQIGTCPAYRASAVIIHQPPRGWMTQAAWEDWLAWTHTRLMPGCQKAHTIL